MAGMETFNPLRDAVPTGKIRRALIIKLTLHIDKAFAMARTFSQRLPLALEELPRECGCLVVLKSAVAGPTPRTVDLTAQLRRKVEAP
mgnify:CR=1 FL=1